MKGVLRFLLLIAILTLNSFAAGAQGNPTYINIFLSALNSLLVFYLVYSIFSNYWHSILSLASFGIVIIFQNSLTGTDSIITSINTALLLLILISFVLWEKTKRHSYFALLVFTGFASLFLMPSAAIFSLSIIGPYMLICRDDIASLVYRKKAYFWTIIASAFFSVLMMAVKLYKSRSTIDTLEASYSQLPSSVSSFGIFGFLMMLSGVMYILLREKNKLLFIWMVSSIIQLYLFYALRITFMQFETLFVFYMAVMSILAGTGASALIALTNRLQRNKAYIITAGISIITLLTLPYTKFLIWIIYANLLK